ncbi:MAG: exo-alpha-sialidase [Phycisphaerales bacterium]|nr:exo-alpha-sialidase [Phycisphaerales bacterium]
MLLACLAAVHLSGPVRIDLDADTSRQVVVDREPGVYLGHVSTILLHPEGEILAAYPKGHGRGPIILKRSRDGGRTWSDRLPTPASWETSQETPTLFSMGGSNLILFSGLFPIRAARSSDLGETWSELEPIGDFGGIVAMGSVAQVGEGAYAAFFHDDGRFLRRGGKAAGTFTLLQTDTTDAGATWSEPRAIWSGSDIHLCEPGLVTSPDGDTLALLLRENRRVRPSMVIFSDDGATTWTDPAELPRALTGDRHTAAYGPDGRLVVTFRCMAPDDPWRGDWVAWVGRWEDIAAARRAGAPGAQGGPAHEAPGATYLVRLKDNKNPWDSAYPGLHALADGTLVATTYGSWIEGEQPFILSVRFRLDELDERALKTPREGAHEP